MFTVIVPCKHAHKHYIKTSECILPLLETGLDTGQKNLLLISKMVLKSGRIINSSTEEVASKYYICTM